MRLSPVLSFVVSSAGGPAGRAWCREGTQR